MYDDTIAAIATPLGEGGLAVVRLSGAEALRIADQCFLPTGKNSLKPSAAPTHTIQFGKMVRDGKVIDEVLLAVLRAPRTFTREDTVEISCHGGLLPAKLVLDALLAGGARLAETVQALPTANPKPSLLPIFSRLDELTRQLPSNSDPSLLHYLHKKSYEKARLFLQGRDAENQAGNCRHV